MNNMDDWSKLDGLKKKYDKMIEKREKIKKIYGIFSLGAFGGVGALASAIVAEPNYQKAKVKVNQQLVDYVETTKQELYDKYYAVRHYFELYPDATVDENDFAAFLRAVFVKRELDWVEKRGDTWVVWVGDSKPEYVNYANDYLDGKFAYILDNIKDMQDYSMTDSLSDTLTIPTGIGAGLGAVAMVALSYGITKYQYKKQYDIMRTEIDKLEDKLYWNK